MPTSEESRPKTIDIRIYEEFSISASEEEVAAFKQKFSEVRDEFWAEVTALYEGEKTDSSRADELHKMLIKEYSIPSAVWLQLMKDYDLEEFDDAITMARRKYGALCYQLKKYGKNIILFK